MRFLFRVGVSAAVLSSNLVLGALPALADATPECNDGTGTDSTECGTDSRTAIFGNSERATAVGNTAYADANNSTAIGAGAVAYDNPTPNTSTSYGAPNAIRAATLAEDPSATAIGAASYSFGSGTVAIGDGALVGLTAGSSYSNVDGGTAVGSRSLVTGENSTVLGFSAQATAANAVAIGANSVADEANTVSIGSVGSERQLVNLAAGEVSASSTDAVNGSQLFATNQDVASNAAGIAVNSSNIAVNAGNIASNATVIATNTTDISTNATNISTNSSSIAVNAGNIASNSAAIALIQSATLVNEGRFAALESDVGVLFDLTSTLDKNTQRGIASIAAAANPHFPSAAGRTSYASNVAVYRGEIGFSVGLMHRLEGDFAITAGASYAGGNSTAVRAGVAGEF